MKLFVWKCLSILKCITNQFFYFNFIFLLIITLTSTSANAVDTLVEQGRSLFFNETFDGNGRTCASCHRAERNFSIDAEFIATLPSDDPLFVAEFVPELAGLEDPDMLRQFGLIRANVDGFDDPTQKFALRSINHLFTKV